MHRLGADLGMILGHDDQVAEVRIFAVVAKPVLAFLGHRDHVIGEIPFLQQLPGNLRAQRHDRLLDHLRIADLFAVAVEVVDNDNDPEVMHQARQHRLFRIEQPGIARENTADRCHLAAVLPYLLHTFDHLGRLAFEQLIDRISHHLLVGGLHPQPHNRGLQRIGGHQALVNRAVGNLDQLAADRRVRYQDLHHLVRIGLIVLKYLLDTLRNLRQAGQTDLVALQILVQGKGQCAGLLVLIQQLNADIIVIGFQRLGKFDQQMLIDLQVLDRTRGLDVIHARAQLCDRVKLVILVE